MKDGFTRKKVESLTLGEKMKKLRSDFRMSLSEVSKATRIQIKYLEYLEEGQYEKLPADVYVRGFLRSYARYLNIDEQVFVKLYERECNIQTNLGRDVARKTFHVKNLHISSFSVTPRSVMVACIFLVVLSPTNGMTIDASEIRVEGKTDKGARVSINNQSVFVENDGTFADQLVLQPGLNTVTVVAINRFDKTKSETLSLEARYTLSSPMVAETTLPIVNPAETFHLDVRVTESATKIIVEADGIVVYSGVLKPGEVQTIEAKETIKVISENAMQTRIRLNDMEEQALDNDKQVSEATFTVLGKQE